MMYALEDLLKKMGAPEVGDKGYIHWRYFDGGELAGSAAVNLSGGRLIAELKHMRRDYEDDAGRMHPVYAESIYLHAERSGDRYRVTKLALDGEEYSYPQKALVELGLSIFYARCLDISIRMIEQSFNKEDILCPVVDENPQFKDIPVFKRASCGVVVPFRPR